MRGPDATMGIRWGSNRAYVDIAIYPMLHYFAAMSRAVTLYRMRTFALSSASFAESARALSCSANAQREYYTFSGVISHRVDPDRAAASHAHSTNTHTHHTVAALSTPKHSYWLAAGRKLPHHHNHHQHQHHHFIIVTHTEISSLTLRSPRPLTHRSYAPEPFIFAHTVYRITTVYRVN